MLFKTALFKTAAVLVCVFSSMRPDNASAHPRCSARKRSKKEKRLFLGPPRRGKGVKKGLKNAKHDVAPIVKTQKSCCPHRKNAKKQ